MSNRTVHLIHSECDIFVQRIGTDAVRVRITEKDPEIINPTDFELEGNSAHIAEALATIASVLSHSAELFQKDPN